MKNLLFLTIACFYLAVTACKKDEKPYFTITGRLIENCGGYPRAAAYLELIQPRYYEWNEGNYLSTYTNSEGYFEFRYQNNTNNHISLFYGAPGHTTTLFPELPAGENIDLGNVYIDAKANFLIKLNVFNSYTSSDTLSYTNYSDLMTKRKIGGPFSSGILDSIFNFATGDPIYPDGHSQLSLGWRLNQNQWNVIFFNVVPCDTAAVEINLR